MSDAVIDLVLQREPLRRQKLYEIVVERIERMVRAGDLKPGDILPSEREIMTAFDIGRPAVREAMLALHNKGLITTENGRRARVRLPSVDNVMSTLDSVVAIMINRADSLKNLFDLRIFVEVAMARHAAKEIDAPRLLQLKTALSENKRAIGDRERFMQTDIHFHRVLFQTVENPVFDAIHGTLVNWIMGRWRKIERTDATETIAYQGHLQIYKTVSKHDPDAAEKAMREHLEASWKTWVKHLGDS